MRKRTSTDLSFDVEEGLYKPETSLLFVDKKSVTPAKSKNDIQKKRKKVNIKTEVRSSRNPLELGEEEAILVGKAVKKIMDDIKSGKEKTYRLEEVIARENKRRGLD